MKNARVLVLGALLLAPVAGRAQTVRGVVVDDATREPVAGVLVELLSPDSGRVAAAVTDSAGEFEVSPRATGDLLVRLRHIGYAPVDSAALRVAEGERVEVELRLARTAIPLEPLVVTMRRDRRIVEFYERRERGGFGYFLARSDIEARAGARTTDLLRGVPGVRVVPASRGTGPPMGSIVTMRGVTGPCLPTVYINGVVVEQDRDSTLDDWLAPHMLEGVEVYPGMAAAPTSLHARDGCGVLAFWTRSDLGRPWSWKRVAAAAGVFVLGILLGSQLMR